MNISVGVNECRVRSFELQFKESNLKFYILKNVALVYWTFVKSAFFFGARVTYLSAAAMLALHASRALEYLDLSKINENQHILTMTALL